MHFSTIIRVWSLKSLSVFICSFLFISLKIWFCQFARCSSLFFFIEHHRSQNHGSLKSEEQLSNFKERCAQLWSAVIRNKFIGIISIVNYVYSWSRRTWGESTMKYLLSIYLYKIYIKKGKNNISFAEKTCYSGLVCSYPSRSLSYKGQRRQPRSLLIVDSLKGTVSPGKWGTFLKGQYYQKQCYWGSHA